MTIPSWPAELPQLVLQDGYQETMPNTRLRTQMDQGPAKVRRRFSAGVRPFSLLLDMSSAQVAIFDTFYNTTLEGGSLSFSWKHPRTGANVTFRFGGDDPTITSAGGDRYSAAIKLEILP